MQEKRASSLNRRNILTAAGVSGLALTAQAGCAPTRKVEGWDAVADVVVVGSGAAAAAAAVTAHSLGASAIIVEKGDFFGGTTARSGGTHWVPNNSIMRGLGAQDLRPDALRYMARQAYPDRYVAGDKHLGLDPLEYRLLETFYDRGAEALDHLDKIKALQSVIRTDPNPPPKGHDWGPYNYPEYHYDLPENKVLWGRSLSPNPEFGSVTDQLREYVETKGIPVRLEHDVIGVHRDESGAVVGVRAMNEGREVNIGARKGVVFGTGGFSHNVSLRRAFLRGPVFNSCAVPTNTGGFIPIAAGLGADLGNLNNAWWAQQPLEMALSEPGVVANMFMTGPDSMFMVNQYGERVVNERRHYNDRAQVHFHWDPTKREYPNLVLFMIYDEAVAQNPNAGFPIPPPGQTAPHIISAPTLKDLAAKIDERLARYRAQTGDLTLDANFASTLAATTQRFNAMAAAGKDLDFGRGESPSQQYFSRPAPGRRDQKNRAMYPLSNSGPYYCVPLVAATLDTKGGPKINEHAQLIRPDGSAIEGIYGAGNCIASPAGQAYWSAGSTLGPALVFGYLAAKKAVSSAGRDPVRV